MVGRRSTLFAIAMILAAAGSGATAGEECLPPQISLVAPGSATPALPDGRRGNAVVYLDDSMSMQGFAQPKAGQEAVFADTILGLRQALEQVSEKATFNRFGADITPLPTNDLAAPIRPSFYVCLPKSKNKADRDGCETRIDKVLAAVASSDKDTLSLLITDLYLSNKEMLGSEYGTMRNSLERVLLAGKSIGILGVLAPFDGKIYDIPGRPASFGLPYRGDRPFFLLIIGNDDAQILNLQRIVQAQLLANIAQERHRFVLFTLHPAHPATAATPLSFDENGAVRLDGRLSGGPERLPILVLAKGAAPIARQPLVTFQETDTTALGGFTPSQALWVYRKSPQCRSRWIPWQHAGLIRAEADDRDLVLRLDPNGLRGLPRQTFLLHVKVDATKLGASSAPTKWLHEWSFSDEQLRKRQRLLSRPQPRSTRRYAGRNYQQRLQTSDCRRLCHRIS